VVYFWLKIKTHVCVLLLQFAFERARAMTHGITTIPKQRTLLAWLVSLPATARRFSVPRPGTEAMHLDGLDFFWLLVCWLEPAREWSETGIAK
jgi:hypothetical protein